METIKSSDNTIVAIGGNVSPVEYWKARSERAEKKLESYEYLVAYANDIIETWPTITMRTLWRMTEKVATLKQTLKEIV